jgi:hypothetical protein
MDIFQPKQRRNSERFVRKSVFKRSQHDNENCSPQNHCSLSNHQTTSTTTVRRQRSFAFSFDDDERPRLSSISNTPLSRKKAKASTLKCLSRSSKQDSISNNKNNNNSSNFNNDDGEMIVLHEKLGSGATAQVFRASKSLMSFAVKRFKREFVNEFQDEVIDFIYYIVIIDDYIILKSFVGLCLERN